MTAVGLALVAGILSALSPCVLPLIPIVFGAALGQHKLGPAALAAGLTLSFVIVGLFVATIGFSAGLGHELFRYGAAVALAVMGAVLLLPRLQAQLSVAAGPVGNWVMAGAGGPSGRGLGGQFVLGLLLGVVWTPCVGPTLGAASVLAARAENLGGVAIIMLAFGIGAALPLLALGTLSREAMLRWRGRLMAAGSGGKVAMGLLLVGVAALIVTGLDKQIEAFLVEASPDWLTALTTKF